MVSQVIFFWGFLFVYLLTVWAATVPVREQMATMIMRWQIEIVHKGRRRGREPQGSFYSLLLLENVHQLTHCSPRESFIRKYEAMDDSSMWKLSTGKVVEKCIYESVIGSSAAEGLAHMWVISSKDPWMKDLFTIEELEEIHSSRILQKATESAQSCWDLLSKFKNVNKKFTVRRFPESYDPLTLAFIGDYDRRT